MGRGGFASIGPVPPDGIAGEVGSAPVSSQTFVDPDRTPLLAHHTDFFRIRCIHSEFVRALRSGPNGQHGLADMLGEGASHGANSAFAPRGHRELTADLEFTDAFRTVTVIVSDRIEPAEIEWLFVEIGLRRAECDVPCCSDHRQHGGFSGAVFSHEQRHRSNRDSLFLAKASDSLDAELVHRVHSYHEDAVSLAPP
jgi:hypothetical protein